MTRFMGKILHSAYQILPWTSSANNSSLYMMITDEVDLFHLLLPTRHFMLFVHAWDSEQQKWL